MRVLLTAGLLALVCCSGRLCAGTPDQIATFIKKDSFGAIRISPTGEYYAASVPQKDRSILVILRRADNRLTATFNGGPDTYVAGFDWVNDERVLISTSRKFGVLDNPLLTGNLYGINADGKQAELLAGQDVNSPAMATLIRSKKVEAIAAFLVDPLPRDERTVLVSVSGFDADRYNRVDRLDVYTGRRVPVARAPVPNAQYVTDAQGVVRFAYGYDVDNNHKLYYRKADSTDWTESSAWQLLNEEAATGHSEFPLGFSADGEVAYVLAEQTTGPDAVVAFHVASGRREVVARDNTSDPGAVIRGNAADGAAPVGVFIAGPKPRALFFNENGADARLYRGLEAAFPGRTVEVTSTTTDGRLALVEVTSDREAGQFFLFDTDRKSAAFTVARRPWQDANRMAEVRPFSMKARDGQQLHGFVTVPAGTSGSGLPLIVKPHGGPFGVVDTWQFDPEVQLLAAAGYAVLQVNFRGSAGYGRAFQQLGAREWGGTMQRDVADATRWAVEQGIADPGRICIYGASYGGYAALMGAAQDSDLYRCAAGYVGIYDLPLMFKKGDTQEVESGMTYLHDWVGDPTQLGARSPVNLATNIRSPVLLAAGGHDERAPIDHSKRMEKALKSAGVSVETLYYPTEGHGFYEPEHQAEFYARLLAFFDRNIGTASSTGDAGAGHGEP